MPHKNRSITHCNLQFSSGVHVHVLMFKHAAMDMRDLPFAMLLCLYRVANALQDWRNLPHRSRQSAGQIKYVRSLATLGFTTLGRTEGRVQPHTVTLHLSSAIGGLSWMRKQPSNTSRSRLSEW